MLGREWGRNLVILVVAILIVGSSLTAIATVIIRDRNPPKSTQTPPPYPNGQQVTSQAIQQSLRDVSGQTYKIVSFQTTDNTAAVRAFYRAALSGEGWQLGNPAPDPDTQRFVWYRSSRSPPMYIFDLTTKAPANGGTDVEVKLSWMPGL